MSSMNFSPREISLAYELLNRDASEREFLRTLGITKTSTKTLLARMRDQERSRSRELAH
jgi:hypothetical protein